MKTEEKNTRRKPNSQYIFFSTISKKNAHDNVSKFAETSTQQPSENTGQEHTFTNKPSKSPREQN